MNELKFKNPIPKNWNPTSGIPQWADVSQDMKLPDGRAYVNPPNNEKWTVEQVMKKGVTHWSAFWGDAAVQLSNKQEYQNKEYYDVPRIEHIFGLNERQNGGWQAQYGYNRNWWPNGPLSYEEAYQVGLNVKKSYGLLIHEIWEGDSYMPPDDSPMWRGYFDGLKEGYTKAGRTDAKIAPNYFFRPGGAPVFSLGMASQAEHESLYTKPVDQWPSNLYSPGHALQSVDLVLQDVYLNSPDSVIRSIFEKLFNMEYLAKQGKESGMFTFPVHEWHPGYVTSIELENGTLQRSDKMPVDPGLMLALPFLSQEWGTTYANWTGSGFFNPTDKRELQRSWMGHKDTWVGKDGGGTYPYYTNGNYYSPIPHPFNLDLSHFGMVNWNTLGAPFRNIKRQYCTYRIDGGPWVERSPIGSDIVRAYFEKRRVVCARPAERSALVYTFDLFTDNRQHKLEVQNPNNPTQIWTGMVAGNGLDATVVQW